MLLGLGAVGGAALARWSFPALAADDGPGHEARLKALGIELPKVAPSRATLVPTARVGETLYVSGHIPTRAGKPVVGKLGKDTTTKEGAKIAREVGLIILSVVRAELGSLDKVVRLVKTLGMVNCTPDYTETPLVVNGFSDLMVEVFGDKAGKGTRSAVGMVSLPLGVAVEVECVFQVK
ncbi:MAG: RidA family protein [Gemmataceae bacterium]|nr:RidA family protein [Gemmataceae bacterium]